MNHNFASHASCSSGEEASSGSQGGNSGEPGRSRTSNPLLNPETLCSWLFLHFHASCITVSHGVWRGFVPKLVPRFRNLSKCRMILAGFRGKSALQMTVGVLLNRFAELNFHEQEMEALVTVVAQESQAGLSRLSYCHRRLLRTNRRSRHESRCRHRARRRPRA